MNNNTIVKYINKDKGQTLVVGSLLLIGLAVAFIVFLQVSVFPDVNEEREIDSQGESLNSMIELRSAMQTAVSTGASQTVNFQNQVDYPLQPAAPPNQRGQISFISGELEINNAEQIIRYDNGTEKERTNFNDIQEDDVISTMIYQPTYIELTSENRKISMDNTVVRERTPSGDVRHTGQSIINGEQITLIAMETRDVDGIKTSNNIPLSINPTETINAEITDSGSPIEIVMNSNRRDPVSEEPWAELDEDDNVSEVREESGSIEIELESDETYDLNFAYADLEL